MRFTFASIALFTALVLGQTGQNAINIPAGQQTLEITADQSTTITWQNPSSGTVTIRLQYSGTDQLASSGIVLASSIPASGGAATFVIPADAVTASGSYTLRITDDTNPSNVNFAPAFTVAGAQGTASLPSSGTATTGSTTATGTSDSSSTTDDSTTTSSDSSSTTGTQSSASKTSRSATSSSATAQTTSAPSNAAGLLKAQAGGMLAAAAAAAALL